MASKVTTIKIDQGARVQITNKYGNSMAAALTEVQTLALVYDLIRTLPADNALRNRLI
jgi:hypothetical protein